MKKTVLILLMMFLSVCQKSQSFGGEISNEIVSVVSRMRNGEYATKEKEELSRRIMSVTNNAMRINYFKKWADALLSTTINDVCHDNPRRCMSVINSIISCDFHLRLSEIPETSELIFDIDLDLIDWLRDRLKETGDYIENNCGDLDGIPGRGRPEDFDERHKWSDCYKALFHNYRALVELKELRLLDDRHLKPEVRDRRIKKIEKRFGRKIRTREQIVKDREWYFQRDMIKIEKILFPWPPPIDKRENWKARRIRDKNIDIEVEI